jgi:lipoprotein-anchoring transpeptidase ErfK/SrfK
MRRTTLALIAALASLVPLSSASADVRVIINKSSQQMRVYVNGSLHDVWPVSTGRRGYGTPSGSFRPQRLATRYYSQKYRGASMHNAIFFHGGYAIHATTEVGRLGVPASHGCVRLHPSHAAELQSLVRTYGPRSTRISITQ